MENFTAVLKNRVTLILLVIATLLIVAVIMIINMIDDITGNLNKVKASKVAKFNAIVGETATNDSKNIKELIDRHSLSDKLELGGRSLSEPLMVYAEQRMHRVSFIDLSFTTMPTRSLVHLQRMPLQFVNLGDTSYGDEGVEIISKVRTIRNFWLDNSGITDAAFSFLSQLPTLNEVRAGHNGLSDKAIHNLLPCSNTIGTLLIPDNHFTKSALIDLQKFSELHFLEIGHSGLSAKDLCTLSGVKKLRALLIHSHEFRGEDFLPFASTLNQLEELGLDGSDITDKELLAIGKMKNLKKLFLIGCKKITPQAIASFHHAHPSVELVANQADFLEDTTTMIKKERLSAPGF